MLPFCRHPTDMYLLSFRKHNRCWFILSVYCCSVAQLCLIFCNPMDCSKPGLLILHYLLEFAKSQVHWVGDTIQPSHPLSSPSPPALSLPGHQEMSQVFASGGQCWSFNFSISPFNEYSGLISFRMDYWISLLSKGLSRVFSNSMVQKHQFFSAQISL